MKLKGKWMSESPQTLSVVAFQKYRAYGSENDEPWSIELYVPNFDETFPPDLSINSATDRIVSAYYRDLSGKYTEFECAVRRGAIERTMIQYIISYRNSQTKKINDAITIEESKMKDKIDAAILRGEKGVKYEKIMAFRAEVEQARLAEKNSKGLTDLVYPAFWSTIVGPRKAMAGTFKSFFEQFGIANLSKRANDELRQNNCAQTLEAVGKLQAANNLSSDKGCVKAMEIITALPNYDQPKTPEEAIEAAYRNTFSTAFNYATAKDATGKASYWQPVFVRDGILFAQYVQLLLASANPKDQNLAKQLQIEIQKGMENGGDPVAFFASHGFLFGNDDAGGGGEESLTLYDLIFDIFDLGKITKNKKLTYAQLKDLKIPPKIIPANTFKKLNLQGDSA